MVKGPKPLGVPLNRLHVMGIYTKEKHDFKKEDFTPLELLQHHMKNIAKNFIDMKKTLQEYEAEIDTLKAEISTLRVTERASPPTYKEVLTQGIQCALIGGNRKKGHNAFTTACQHDGFKDECKKHYFM